MCVSAIIRRRQQEAHAALRLWRELWHEEHPIPQPELESLEYLVAELGPEAVESAMRLTRDHVEPGSGHQVGYFLAICSKRRKTDWSSAARTVWIAEADCPVCQEPGIAIRLENKRVRAECIETGIGIRTARGRLAPR